MNNSKLIEQVNIDTLLPTINYINEDPTDKVTKLRVQAQEITELMDAINHIKASSYWKVIKAYLEKDLQKLINQLEKSNDTTAMFRLQGEITRTRKLDLDKILEDKKQELDGIRKMIREYGE